MNQKKSKKNQSSGLVPWLRRVFGGVKVYALIGKSGTGKSFRAKLVAEKYGISHIVDDGLLIHDNSIVAGKSAKRENVYMGAIRTALFDDELHRKEVISAIKNQNIQKILFLGTSDRMVGRMAEQLNLPAPFKIIQIEEISTPADIEKAQKSRNEEGKHVIPVPAIEVERDYPHLLSHAIKVLFKHGLGRKKKTGFYEKAVVRPRFDGKNRGNVAVSEQALGQMIAHCVDEFNSELTVKKVKIRPHNNAYRIRTEVEAPYGHNWGEELYELQNFVITRIVRFTGIIIEELDLVVSSIGSSKNQQEKLSDEHENPEVQGTLDKPPSPPTKE